LAGTPESLLLGDDKGDDERSLTGDQSSGLCDDTEGDDSFQGEEIGSFSLIEIPSGSASG